MEHAGKFRSPRIRDANSSQLHLEIQRESIKEIRVTI